MNYRQALVFSIAFTAMSAFGQVRLPAVLSSGMVLEQNDSAGFWGWAAPAEKVFITPSWSGKTDSVVASNGARWKIRIKTPAAGGPYKILIKASNAIEISDVLIGEVWVCSGQSNMEMNEGWGLPDVRAELPNCANSSIRFFYIPKTTSAYPQDDCGGKWVKCDSNALKSFSAVGYFFGKRINKELKVPVGLINANWGGTPAEVWTPAEMVNGNPELKVSAEKLKTYDWWPKVPGSTFNGMIAPITNYPIAGAIWYQGEGNTDAPPTYGKLMEALIDGWRAAWKKDISFYYVQIAPFKYGTSNVGNLIREQQGQVSGYHNVGMAVISDLVDDTTDIHPKNKHEVGARLANWALARTYHQRGFAYMSPVYQHIEVKKDKAYLYFDNTGGALIARGKKIQAFEIAGVDRHFYPAMVNIEGDYVQVWSPQVKSPAAVRFSFSNTAIGNLFSKDGLPVAPFRTDDWSVDQVPVK